MTLPAVRPAHLHRAGQSASTPTDLPKPVTDNLSTFNIRPWGPVQISRFLPARGRTLPDRRQRNATAFETGQRSPDPLHRRKYNYRVSARRLQGRPRRNSRCRPRRRTWKRRNAGRGSRWPGQAPSIARVETSAPADAGWERMPLPAESRRPALRLRCMTSTGRPRRVSPVSGPGKSGGLLAHPHEAL